MGAHRKREIATTSATVGLGRLSARHSGAANSLLHARVSQLTVSLTTVSHVVFVGLFRRLCFVTAGRCGSRGGESCPALGAPSVSSSTATCCAAMASTSTAGWQPSAAQTWRWRVPPKHGGKPPGRLASERTLRRQAQRDHAAAKAAARSGAGDGVADEPAASEADGDNARAGRQQPQVEPAASRSRRQPAAAGVEAAATGARAATPAG
eukprot:2573555-Prymnesium_polylepis.1